MVCLIDLSDMSILGLRNFTYRSDANCFPRHFAKSCANPFIDDHTAYQKCLQACLTIPAAAAAESANEMPWQMEEVERGRRGICSENRGRFRPALRDFYREDL